MFGRRVLKNSKYPIYDHHPGPSSRKRSPRHLTGRVREARRFETAGRFTPGSRAMHPPTITRGGYSENRLSTDRSADMWHSSDNAFQTLQTARRKKPERYRTKIVVLLHSSAGGRMPHSTRSDRSSSDAIVIRLTRPKYRPRWTLAYLAASAMLWSAVIAMGVRAGYWILQQ